MIMDTTVTSNIVHPQSPAYALMKRGKRGVAAAIAADCSNIAQQQTEQYDTGSDAAAVTHTLLRCEVLDNMLDVLLNPYEAIGDWNHLDWLRWIMAGGKTIDEFSSAVKDYDYGTCCGLVWTANYVAYRCRTCSISPCMSLCGDCFKRGDHTGHDFNMFRSQAGGACDCGDTSVMKPDGFCRKHSNPNNNGSDNTSGRKQPPADLLRVAERIMPRLLLRLIQYLRENSKTTDTRTVSTQLPGGVGGAGAGISNPQQQNVLLQDLDPFLGMLHDLSALGAAMRRVMTVALTNEKIYRWACDYYRNISTENVDANNSDEDFDQQQQTKFTMYTDKVYQYYTEAIHEYSTSISSSLQRRHSNTTSNDDENIIPSISESSEDDDYDDEIEQVIVAENEELNSIDLQETEDSQVLKDIEIPLIKNNDFYITTYDFSIDEKNKSRSRKNTLNHTSFLQEIVFWTVRYEFPQKMVCLLLNMLPDAAYKEALTEAFVMHYGCVARVLATTRDSDTLSNHIVHISVQLFSNEALATRMVDKLGLLRVMVSSLRRMMTKILIPSMLHDDTNNKHRVVDCSKAVMKEHCYWPLVSDLNNVLSHRPIAVKFMCDKRLLDSWFSYLSMFQGMNVNSRELGHHVEFEPNTYYAAFSAELEASAYPMWAMLSHLSSPNTLPLASRVLRACLYRLRKWLIDVGYYQNDYTDSNYEENTSLAIIRRADDRQQFTFHLPLHRYLAVFLCQAVRAQGACVEDIIPHGDLFSRDALLLAIAAHPVRAQAAFYEIMQGAWVRNGLQIKGQAMTYIQSNFCISMVDADIYLLQLCLSELSNANIFLSLVLEKFKIYDWLRIMKHAGLPQVMDTKDYDAASSMESLLVFLGTLVGVRTNLCSDKDYDYCQSQLEMVTLLCVSDKTHSQLMELMPERCGSGIQNNTTTTTTTASTSGNSASETLPSLNQQSPPPCTRDFETVLQAVAEYKRPQFEASGNMQQGLYVPLAHVWRNLYDPVHVLLRAVHRRDFQSSMDRYTTFMRSIGLLKQNQTPWPPYRTPQQHHPAYRDPRRVLLTKLFHAVAWHCLYRSAVHRDISEHTLSLLIYLLDQAWLCYNSSPAVVENETTSNMQQQPMDININPSNKQFGSFLTESGECSEKSAKINSDDQICPKRSIKLSTKEANNYCTAENVNDIHNNSISLFERWYDQDDFVHNLCTTITHVEVPVPPYYFNFGTAPEDSTTSSTAASTMATNLLDYFTSSVAAAAAAARSSSPINIPHTFELANPSQQVSNGVPSLATIAGNEIPIATRSNQSDSNAIRPPFYSLNAAAAATSSTMDSALNCVKQRLQFLRPPQSPEQQPVTIEVDVINSHNPLKFFDDLSTNDVTELTKMDVGVCQTNSCIPINESIISLLLKLHSHLSGKADSYQPPQSSLVTTSNHSSVDHSQDEMPSCGDGAYYVGRLLDRMVKKSTSCYECVVRTRLELWPRAVVMRETATREDEERERRERKRRARDKQQKMMEEMARAQRAFLESARLSGDLDSTDTELQKQSQSTSTTVTMTMDFEEAVNQDTATATTTSGEVTASSLPNVLVDMDENSNSSNSTTTTTKESVVGVRGHHQQKSAQTVDCVICNQTVIVQMEQQSRDPVGLVILVQGTNVLAHRRHILSVVKDQYNANNIGTDCSQQQQMEVATAITNNCNINYDKNNSIEEGEQNYYRFWPTLPPLQSQHHQQSTSKDNNCDSQHHQSLPTIIDDDDLTTYASHSDRRKRLLTEYFCNLDKADSEIGALTTTTSAIPIGGNAHVQTCGHHLHLRCWSSYLASLRGAQRFNSDRGEYSCPLCRQLANSLMPLMPADAIDQHRSVPSNTINATTAMSDSMKVLTVLINQEALSSRRSSPYRSPCINSATGSGDYQLPPTSQISEQHIHYVEGLLPNQVRFDGSGRLIGVDNYSNSRYAGGTEDFPDDSLMSAITKCVHNMISTTVISAASHTVTLPPILLTSVERDNLYKVRWYSVVSVAWTNIQVELVQRNNSLIEHRQQSIQRRGNYCHRHYKNAPSATVVTAVDVSSSNNHYNMLPKRNCIAPLLKVLRVNARYLMEKYQLYEDYIHPLSDIWNKLIGTEQPQKNVVQPPLLMRDPCSILLELVLLLPALDNDLFDTLVKLTYNMQLFVAALKVAVAWQHSNNRRRRNDCRRPSKTSTETEESCIGSNSNNIQIDLDDGCNNYIPHVSSSIDYILEGNNVSTPLLRTPFLQAVAFANSVVFLSNNDNDTVDIDMDIDEDEFAMHHDSQQDNVGDINIDVSAAITNSSERDYEECIKLESYGRQCTLPFLRFAALLKKYTNGDENSDNLDDNHDPLTVLSTSQQQNNMNVEHKQDQQLLQNSDQTQHGHHYHDNNAQSPPSVEPYYSGDDLTKISPPYRHHWSQDDYEFLTLVRYLKLLNSNDQKTCEHCDWCEENCEDYEMYENKDECQHGASTIKQHTPPMQLPSAMDAVIWPEWSYSGVDNVATTMSRAWLIAFRDSLTAPKPIIIGSDDNATGVASTSDNVDANTNTLAPTNILMSARLLLAIDCCDGAISIINNSMHHTGGSSDSAGFSAVDGFRSQLPMINWMGPRLLKLPHLYDDVFQYYHGRPCLRCHGIPRETSVCLVCGTVVCLKENCCKTNGTNEAVQHSLECGGGTGIYLVVTSSSVVVIRGKRACLWGSVYLDAFGEEDRELKRGKPLYLSAERYRLLERQWLAHRFDHTNKKWVWHRDAL